MREPLLLPVVAVVLGIIAGKAFDFPVRDAVWPAAALALLACARVSAGLRRTALLLALFFAGAFLFAVHRPTRIPFIDANSREMMVAEGCVVEPTVFSEDRAQFVLELEPGARAQVQVPKYAEQENPPRLHYGQRVEIEARFRPPHNFQNPGAFDYAAYLAHRDTYWSALVPAKGSVRVLPGECSRGFRQALGRIFALRTAALDRIESLYPNDDYSSAMLQAVLIGETANMERIWTEDFRRSGTYHALVISGIHVSVLAGLLLTLLRWTPLSKGSALFFTAISAWVYALVSGFTAPVVRAAAGFTLYLVARIFFRCVRPLNFLAAIALVYLAWDPQQLFEASFQLSFLSIVAIAAFAAPLLERTTGLIAFGTRDINALSIDPHIEPRAAQFRVELRLAAETIALWTRIPVRIAAVALSLATRLALFVFELVVLSLAVQVGLALPMAEYFHRISFTGVVANILIVPLMNAVIPLGFAAIFTNWHWLASLVSALLGWSAAIARFFALREPAWRVPDPPLWLSIAFVATIVLGAVLIRKSKLRWPAVAVTVVLLALLIASPWRPDIIPGELELTAIDVGQGDSLLLAFPQGATMLVDGGGRLEFGMIKRRSNLEIGEDVVSPYLWTRGIRHIDVIVATHAHQDHIGGLRALIANFHPSELWVGANPPRDLMNEAEHIGTRVIERRASDPFPFSGATLQVLAPATGYLSAKPGNNDSIVLRAVYGSRSFLLTGDLESAEEYRLLGPGHPALAADVLKVGHHGSRTSTADDFLKAVSPSVAIISAGYENSFGHPHPDVVHRLADAHVTILRTDIEGAATVRTDGKHLIYKAQAWEPNQHRWSMAAHLIH
jgi:competence protein ComEC